MYVTECAPQAKREITREAKQKGRRWGAGGRREHPLQKESPARGQADRTDKNHYEFLSQTVGEVLFITGAESNPHSTNCFTPPVSYLLKLLEPSHGTHLSFR